MLVPSSLKIIELGAGSFALKSYLAENLGAAKAFKFIKIKFSNIINANIFFILKLVNINFNLNKIQFLFYMKIMKLLTK